MRVRYTPQPIGPGQFLLRPMLPVILTYDTRAIEVSGLIDTGSDVNVLPYFIGLQLGVVWENQPPVPPLSGNMGQYETRALWLDIDVKTFKSVTMGFAWTRKEDSPIILGHINFLQEFDVCFFSSENAFDIERRRTL